MEVTKTFEFRVRTLSNSHQSTPPMDHTAPISGVPTLPYEERKQTNPSFATCTQPIPLAVGSAQIQTCIVDKRRELLPSHDDVVLKRTLQYVTSVLRSGIYVLIQNNEVALYVPFTAGPEFRNGWSAQLTIQDHPGGLEDTSQWWANAGIICTRPTSDFWGASFVAAYRHMFQEAAAKGVTFFEGILNKRDHPCVRKDGRHPWPHVWSSGEPPPVVVEGAMLPFLSSYTGPDYTDLNIPLSFPDWEFATGLVFPGDKHRWPPRSPSPVAWGNKNKVAFFRGSNTGEGVREALCALHGKRIMGVRIDAQITRWSRRHRVSNGVVTAPVAQRATGKYVGMHQQSYFKYLIIVDGHSAPNRIGMLLLTGSLILRVAGTSAGRHIWLDEYLEPMVHFLPIASDLSDLESQITWAERHPNECKDMASRARDLGTRLLTPEVMSTHLQQKITSTF